MKVIRPIHISDLDQFEKIVSQISTGMTSLPKDRKHLAHHIDESELAFSTTEAPHHITYTFVLEDLNTNKLIGTCGIRSKTGINHPIHSYQIETEETSSSIEHVLKAHKMLRAIKHHSGPSEVCGLYLDPNCRKASLGHLLSYSRFLFMASHPHRFTESVVAEMRGSFDENNESPFWNYVGRTFYDVSYNDAVKTRIESPETISQLVAKHPIYIDLLPPNVKEVIGKTHAHTEAALNLLLKIGFSITDEVDIFDAGPKLTAPLQHLSPVEESRVLSILNTSDTLPEEPWIIANTKLDYRACVGHAEIQGNGVALEKKTLEALEVQVNDKVRLYKL